MTKNTADSYSIQIINQPSELNIVVRCIEMLADRWAWSEAMVNKVNLSLEEIIANIIFHGYNDEKEHLIALRFERKGDKFQIQVEDDGIAFNPIDSDIEVDVNAGIEAREVGGLGIHIVKTMMDELNYQRVGDKNRITLIKEFNK